MRLVLFLLCESKSLGIVDQLGVKVHSLSPSQTLWNRVSKAECIHHRPMRQSTSPPDPLVSFGAQQVKSCWGDEVQHVYLSQARTLVEDTEPWYLTLEDPQRRG